MRWLEQRRRERRWWVASASVGVMSLVLGVLGVVPVFADVSGATCVVESGDDLTVSWTGLPDGLELVLLAETSRGRLRSVDTDNVGDVVGYGSTGSFTGQPYPGAVRYHLSAGSAGSVPCTSAASDPPAGTVDIAVANGVGASNPGFSTGTCPVDPGGRQYGWHFVLTGTTASFTGLSVVFASGVTVTDFVSDPSPKHAYVYIAGPDTIVSAVATIEGPVTTRMVLSHVCAPATPPPPTPTATTPAVPTATTPAVPTATTPAVPTATTPAVPTATTPAAPTATTPAAPTATSTPGPVTPRTPAALSARIGVDCEAGAITITIVNTGESAGVAEIMIGGQLVDAPSVAGGETLTATHPIPSGTTTASVVVEGTAIASSSVTDPCVVAAPRVSATVALDCGNDVIEVGLTNTGNATAEVTVVVNGESQNVTVAPGRFAMATFARPASPSEASVMVSLAGRTILQKVFDASCAASGPELDGTVDIVCVGDAAQATVTLRNTGDRAGVATIVAGELTRAVEVMPGQQVESSLTMVGTGPVTISVSGPTGTILAAAETIDVCERPAPELAADLSLDCATGELVIVIENRGRGDGVAHVEMNGTSTALEVPAGGSVTHIGPIPTKPVRIVVHDGSLPLLDRTVSSACTQPAAKLTAIQSVDCSVARLEVVLTNKGDLAGVATVMIDGSQVLAVEVAPGRTLTEHVALDPTTAHTVTVLADGGATQLLTDTVDPCTVPIADVKAVASIDCEAGAVTVTLSNLGDAPGAITVAIGDTTETVVVPAGGVVQRTASVTIGGITTVRVTGADKILLDETTADTCAVAGPAVIASTVLDCANREIVVRLANGGDADADVVVRFGETTQVIRVAAGSSSIVMSDLGASGDYDVEVSVDGETILAEQASGACAVPDGNILASVELSCTRSQAEITISNGRGSAADIVVTTDGTGRTLTVDAGDLVTTEVPLTEDRDYEIAVTTSDGISLASARGTFDCEDAQVKGKTTIKDPEKPDDLRELPRTGAAHTAVLVTAGLALIATGAAALKAATVRRERLGELR